MKRKNEFFFGLVKIGIGKGRRKRRYRRKKSEESMVGQMQRKRQFWGINVVGLEKEVQFYKECESGILSFLT